MEDNVVAVTRTRQPGAWASASWRTQRIPMVNLSKARFGFARLAARLTSNDPERARIPRGRNLPVFGKADVSSAKVPRACVMLNLPSFSTSFRDFARDCRGNVMLMFAGMAVGFVLMVGGAVDYSRAIQFKTSLQSLADASALAGASAYVSADTANTAVTVATNYFNAGLSKLPQNSGVGTPTITTPSDASGYYVKVSVPTSTINTTFLSLIMNSIGVQVSATAKDPIVTAGANFGGFFSSAYDHNTIYWYKVPSDRSVPQFNPANFPSGTYSDGTFTAFWTNIAADMPPASNLTFQIAAAQKIGFALVNVTGGRIGYGSGQYPGQSQGSTHVFYTQLDIPNASSNSPGGYPASAGYNSGRTEDCSLQTQRVADINTTPTAPIGSCYGTTPQTLASPTCAEMGNKTVRYFWNDMGGGHDDRDYNDLVFNFGCANGGPSTTGVILTD